MLKHLMEECNDAETENGAPSLLTTGSDCLDLFATIGALRYAKEKTIRERFLRAFAENRDIAMKLLFFARDIREGLGERRVFRVILRYLAENEADSVRKNLPFIAEFGRFDDMLCLADTPCEEAMLDYLKEKLSEDLTALREGRPVSLLGKWLPSINASSTEAVILAKRIAKAFGMSEKEYRKALVSLRAKIRIIENNLRVRDYTFDYETQPSKALLRYRRAFLRNDAQRYLDFIHKATRGQTRLHADTLAPYELIDPYLGYSYSDSCFIRTLKKEEQEVLNATWNSLPDYTTYENALAVIDTSGSMYCAKSPRPASVALSLGIYFAEHNTGYFKNHFIEFSEHPQLTLLKGETFYERLQYVASFSEVANTNLEAVFALILKTALKHNVPQHELPSKLILISDMEFDACIYGAKGTNFENAKRKFEAAGYRLPDIVFWNVASRGRQQPVRYNTSGVTLISGCTPSLFQMISSSQVNTPYEYMMEVLGSERYRSIVA